MLLNTITHLAPLLADEFLKSIAQWIGSFMLFITGWLLGLSGLLLEQSLKFTVVEMSTRIDKLPALNEAWGAFRDLSNILFIFIILYIAISTILQIDTSRTKKLLVNVVIIALLLNFSLFFTKVLIDTSNILAIQFHQTIVQAGGENGVAGAFMQQLNLQSFANPTGAANVISGTNSALNILLVAVLSSTLFLIVTFVFGAMAIMLLARFIILIFLMVLSPLAFMALALPGSNHFSKWFKLLFQQLVFAPAMLIFIWVTLITLNGILVQDTSTIGASLSDLIPKEGSAEGFFEGKITIILNFIIVIGMAIFSLFAAKELGAWGSSGAINIGKRWSRNIGGAAARGTIRGTRLTGLYEKTQRSKFLNKPGLYHAKEATLGKLVNTKFGGKSATSAEEESKRLRNLRQDIGNKDQMKKAAKKLRDRRDLTPEAINKIADEKTRAQKQKERLLLMSNISQGAAKISASNFEGALPENLIGDENIMRNLPDAHFDALMKGSRFSDEEKGKMMEARIGWVRKGLKNPNASEELKSEITNKIKRNTSEREFEHINQNMPELFDMPEFVQKIPMGMIKKIESNPTFGAGAGEEIKLKKYTKFQKAIEGQEPVIQDSSTEKVLTFYRELFKKQTDEDTKKARKSAKNTMLEYSPEDISYAPDEIWQTEAVMSSMDEETIKLWGKKDIGEKKMLVLNALVNEKIQKEYDARGEQREILTEEMKHFLDWMRYNESGGKGFAVVESIQKDLGYTETPNPYSSSYKNKAKATKKEAPRKPKDVSRPDNAEGPYDVDKPTRRVNLEPKPETDSDTQN